MLRADLSVHLQLRDSIPEVSTSWKMWTVMLECVGAAKLNKHPYPTSHKFCELIYNYSSMCAAIKVDP
jgi:hypothetical protein